MKRGKSLSDWMNSALGGAAPSSGTSQRPPPPPPSQRRKGGGRPTSRTEPQPLGHKTTPLTAGTLPTDSDIPWSVKYQPQTAAELAVHKKKVSEVQQWMEFALSSHSRHPVLLLVGPPGCGKTATLQALSKDMGFSLLEWTNPLSSVGTRMGEERDLSLDSRLPDPLLFEESQWRQFKNFLVRANRYPSLQVVGGAGGWSQEGEGPEKKKVVLVEEFPNALLRDPSKFHEIMNSVTPTLHYPLVFIVSESHRRQSSTSTLFPKTTVSMLDIHTISFNPVALTSLVKTLQKIASAECQRATQAKKPSRGQKTKFHMPPKEVIENLAESSAGDIRSAINALQFACLRDSSDLLSATDRQHQAKRTSRKERAGPSSSHGGTKLRKQHSLKSESELLAIGGRDCSLFLFRALGKILYCKRDTESEVAAGDSSHSLPPHLNHLERPPLLVDPEAVVEHTHMSPEMFILYLYQNYIDFYEDLDDITAGVQYLSDADVLGRMWTDSSDSRAALLGYSSSVACRGLMHSNNPLHHTAGGKWRPLHKPQWISVNKQYHENCHTARGLFLHLGSSPHAHLWTPVELQTELLPYLALINVPLRNQGQVAILQSITHFKTRYHRLHPETLGEKDIDSYLDVAIDPTTSEILQTTSWDQPPSAAQTASQLSQDTVQVRAEDSDLDIEDFEDDIIW